MTDKVVNWDLNCLSLQDQPQGLHNQLIVEGICREKQGGAQICKSSVT